MEEWRICLGLVLILLCVTEGKGQDVTEDETTTVLNQEDAPFEEVPTISRIQFPKDRKPSGISKRIIGGDVATPNAYPYQVALYVVIRGSLYFCGGTLITTQWVLTAAHCVDGASSAQVLIGAHDISQVEATRIVFNTSTFIIHKGWNETILQNDIALIRLPQKVTLTSNISTVEIAQGTDTYNGILSRCLGWGKTVLGSLSSVLRYVDAEVLTNDNCSLYEDFTPYIVDHHLCTSGEGFVGPCNGDSGGPLIIDGVQVGIVSFGVTDCTTGLPSVFSRVTEFNAWITETIENYIETSTASPENPGGHGHRTGPLIEVYMGVLLSVVLNYFL